MTEHTKTDGLSGEALLVPEFTVPAVPTEPTVLAHSRPRSDKISPEKIECNACPVLCLISPGKSGACDRYANADGALVRVDPVLILRRDASLERGSKIVAFNAATSESEGELFVTGIGASTTYPDYKPAPFIVSAPVNGVDTVTVVTEAIFSYCSFRVKDRKSVV